MIKTQQFRLPQNFLQQFFAKKRLITLIELTVLHTHDCSKEIKYVNKNNFKDTGHYSGVCSMRIIVR